LLDLVHAYAAGRAALSEVERFMGETVEEFALLPDADPMARLAGVIDVSLSEMDDRLIDELELRGRIARFLETYGREFQLQVGTEDATVGDAFVISLATDTAATTGEGRAA
jgi:hypothetical protein